MADYIPFEIQAEIIIRLPIKSLIRFRSVSNPWKSLIHSSKFITKYNVLCRTHPKHHLLVRYLSLHNSERKYVSIADDDTFPQHKIFPSISTSVKLPIIIGSSQGLFCLFNFYKRSNVLGTNIALLWNPTIRKSVAIDVPNVLNRLYETVVGFGVCPHTNDPKLVKITYINYWNEIVSIPWQVEVFTLSSGAWRTPSSNLLPRESIALSQSQAVVNRFIYWLANDRGLADAEFELYGLIMSFDITSEEFTEIYLPDTIAANCNTSLYISKLKESLAVLQSNLEAEKQIYGVWIMDHGSPNSFTKLFTVNAPHASIERVLGFRKSGEPLIEILKEYYNQLFVYEPYLGHINNIRIPEYESSCFVSSYMETLLLLDH